MWDGVGLLAGSVFSSLGAVLIENAQKQAAPVRRATHKPSVTSLGGFFIEREAGNPCPAGYAQTQYLSRLVPFHRTRSGRYLTGGLKPALREPSDCPAWRLFHITRSGRHLPGGLKPALREPSVYLAWRLLKQSPASGGFWWGYLKALMPAAMMGWARKSG